MNKKDILTKMIDIKHKINDLIFEEFWSYCKSQGINQQSFYNKENKQKLNDTIYNFILKNMIKWEKNKNDINTNSENAYIMKYLTDLYDLESLPF